MTVPETHEQKFKSRCRDWRFVLLVILLVTAPIAAWNVRHDEFAVLLVMSLYFGLAVVLDSWIILCTAVGMISGPVGLVFGFLIGLNFDAIRTAWRTGVEWDMHRDSAHSAGESNSRGMEAVDRSLPEPPGTLCS